MDPIDLITQGKINRYFRATRKLNTPDFVSHITQRAAGKEPLFLEDDDYLFMLALLKEISQDYYLRMYAFCLMPNHIHLLFSPKEDNLYDAMRDLFSRYAMRFNKKYERKGHLFGGPYRQAVCMDDSYLLAASLYIHMNPKKAGLTRDPRNYRWSSSRLYCEDDAPKSFIDPDFILDLLSGGRLEQKEQYRLLLKKGRELKTDHVLEQEDSIERFRSKLASIFPSIFRRADKKSQVARFSGIDLLSLDELEKQIEHMKKERSPNRPESRKAKKYLIEQLIARGFKRSEIAERLNLSPKTIYNILKSPL
ncbi:MAG: transposase [Desulfobacteraceae bacterium]|nr:transposase [Desulfobacteraceae bacterium]